MLPAKTFSRMPLRHTQHCALLPDVDYVSKEVRGEKTHTSESAEKLIEDCAVQVYTLVPR